MSRSTNLDVILIHIILTMNTNSFFKLFILTCLMTFITSCYLCWSTLQLSQPERQVIYWVIISAKSIFHSTLRTAPDYGCWDILTQLQSCSNSVKRLYHNKIIYLMWFQVKSNTVLVWEHFNCFPLPGAHPEEIWCWSKISFTFFAWLDWLNSLGNIKASSRSTFLLANCLGSTVHCSIKLWFLV